MAPAAWLDTHLSLLLTLWHLALACLCGHYLGMAWGSAGTVTTLPPLVASTLLLWAILLFWFPGCWSTQRAIFSCSSLSLWSGSTPRKEVSRRRIRIERKTRKTTVSWTPCPSQALRFTTCGSLRPVNKLWPRTLSWISPTSPVSLWRQTRYLQVKEPNFFQ